MLSSTARESGWQEYPKIEYVEVTNQVANQDGELSFSFDAGARGLPLDHHHGLGDRGGERLHYSIGYAGPAGLRSKPLRYDPTLVIPADYETIMGFARGPLREWQKAGRIGPKPDRPVLLTAKRTISLGEFIGAVFGEMASENAPDHAPVDCSYEPIAHSDPAAMDHLLEQYAPRAPNQRDNDARE